MYSLLIIATVSIARVFAACFDGVDNVIAIDDCGSAGSIIKIQNLKALTYDDKKQPKCYTDSGKSQADLYLPGFLKISSGEVVVSQSLDMQANNARLLLNLAKNSWLIGKVCKDGVSQHTLVPDKICNVTLCKGSLTKGSLIEACEILDKPGTYNVVDLDPKFKDFIALPQLADAFVTEPFVRGQWKGGIEIQYGGRVIGCAILPGKANGEWVWLEE